MKIIMIGVFAVTMTFASTANSNSQPEKNPSNFSQFLLAECKDLYQSRSQQGVCEINKSVGMHKISPYIVGLMKQAQPKQKEILNDCTSHLSLQSRIVDYENTVKCFQTLHFQDIQQEKITGEFDQTKIDQADSVFLLEMGRMFLYGVGMQQDIELAARSMIYAYNKGETIAVKYLVELMGFAGSNGIKLPEKLKEEIVLTILHGKKDKIKTKALEGNVEFIFLMANMAESRANLF
ncbi:MAG: hypothetical protein L3J52_09340 [Proteobacteria bacterium]|nr:hypothetical protein [Pseudomonadota bacterium]